jgi:hypothetical protein
MFVYFPKRFSWKDVKKQQNKNPHGNKSIHTTVEDVNTNNSLQPDPVKPACPWYATIVLFPL